MKYLNDYYTSIDRTLSVEFLIVDLGDARGLRAYILSDINYLAVSPARSTSQHDVHKLYENDDKMICEVKNFIANNPPLIYGSSWNPYVEYVCWTREIYSLEEIMSVVSVWTDITAYYIQNGGTFPEIQQILSRQGII